MVNLPSSYIRFFLFIALSLGLSVRFFHFNELIEDPHSWRQSDTGQYIWYFYEHGIDLLHPGVCWMGNAPNIILEFPFYEAVVAVGYHLWGPSHIIAKVITFGFFLISLYFFHQILVWIYDRKIALLAVTLLAWMPLGMYYSRAVHIDFSAMSFGMLGLYLFLRWLRTPNIYLLIGSVSAFTLGALIKAPYLMCFVFPLSYQISIEKRWKSVFTHSYLLLVPILAFFLWRHHVFQVNSAAPDWFFIPGYQKFIHMSDWYFGTMSQRLDLYIWSILLPRFVDQLSGILGGILLLAGLLIWKWNKKSTAFLQLWWWGAALYGLLFFNLNYFHDYYQIPFMFPLAGLMSLTLWTLYQRLSRLHFSLSLAGMFLFVLYFSMSSYLFAKEHYYHLDAQIIQAGQLIRAHTRKNDLLILSAPYMDCRNPNWLYRARRQGWSIEPRHLSQYLINRLTTEGASHLAILNAAIPDSLTHQVDEVQKYPLPQITTDTVYFYRIH